MVDTLCRRLSDIARPRPSLPALPAPSPLSVSLSAGKGGSSPVEDVGDTVVAVDSVLADPDLALTLPDLLLSLPGPSLPAFGSPGAERSRRRWKLATVDTDPVLVRTSDWVAEAVATELRRVSMATLMHLRMEARMLWTLSLRRRKVASPLGEFLATQETRDAFTALSRS